MANAWFRMYAEFVTDTNVQMLSEIDQRRYIMLLCLRCSNVLVTLHDEEIAFQLRISNGEWDKTKSILVEKGLIKNDMSIPNFWKHKGTSYLRQSAEVWMATRRRIFLRDNYTCQYCGKRGVKLECDHIVPVSKGGSNDDCNLSTACKNCNRSKSSKNLSEWMVKNV